MSIYTTFSTLKGILDNSPLKPTATSIKSTPAKHQISASNSCFFTAQQLQLLLKSCSPNKQTLSPQGIRINYRQAAGQRKLDTRRLSGTSACKNVAKNNLLT